SNVPYVVANSSSWVYAGTGLHEGDSIPGIGGYEMDSSMSSAPHPNSVAGTYQELSQSPYVDPGPPPTSLVANSSIYQAPSRAWVFAAGTISWSSGLARGCDLWGMTRTDTGPLPAPRRAMGYKITVDQGILRAELFARETIEETKAFFQAIVSASKQSRSPCILISVRSSKPIFQLERHGLIEYFRKLAVTSSRRIALVGDSKDLRLSHEYVEFIARQHGLIVRTFPDETAAYRW